MKTMILVVLSVLVIGAARHRPTTPPVKPPVARPVKPLTYGELKAENDKLKERIVLLEAGREKLLARIEELRPEIREGMTLAEAEKAAGRKAELKSESNGTQRYSLLWSYDGPKGPPSTPSPSVFVTTYYLLEVADGKVTAWQKKVDRVSSPAPRGSPSRFLK